MDARPVPYVHQPLQPRLVDLVSRRLGSTAILQKKDGHIQGGPLSGTFSTIPIKLLIEEIKKRMEAKHHPIRGWHRKDK